MYYRRRILMGIIEKSNRELYRTELEKLLFLFCKISDSNYYDFFPYKFGCYSFISYQDIGKLVKDRYLEESHEGKIFIAQPVEWNKIKKTDRERINELIVKTEGYRLNDLIKLTYQSYPYYACKSEILENILGKKEAAELRSQYKTENSPCLIGKGYEGITIDRYLSDLISENIQLVIDVRKNPVSMKYNFNKKSLKAKLGKIGVAYLHIPALGIPSALRKQVTNIDQHMELLDNYEKDFLPQAENELDEIRKLQEKYNRIALLCFEKDSSLCHRTRIIRRLKK